MHFINPFKGLRPSEEKVSSVTTPSTDHLSQEMVANHKKDNPWSYLNIFTNEINSKAKEQFELMKNNSTLIKDRKTLNDAMLVTVAGIAAAMKNTG